MDQQSKVAVIGAGVMGEALIAALISSGVNPDRITISEKREERAQELVAKYAIKVAPVSANVADADALLLVVKPQDMATVLEDVKGSINPKAVIITFAAGKTISFISNGLEISYFPSSSDSSQMMFSPLMSFKILYVSDIIVVLPL